MKTSARGIELIKQFEGLELEAYQDIAGIWTIGYGHTGDDVEPGMRISEREAEALLRKDLKPREDAVDRLTSVGLNQNEFDALVSFIYNVGIEAYRGSTARRRLNKNQRLDAADALTWWNKATVNGVLREVTGLTRRRASERALFLTPTNPPLVREPKNISENSRVTPVEDTPRRDNIAESRTVQGATVAGGAGVAASTMGRDSAEELDQVETNIETGRGATEDPSAAEGSTPPRSRVDDDETEDCGRDTIFDGEIDFANDPVADGRSTECADDADSAEEVPAPAGDASTDEDLDAAGETPAEDVLPEPTTDAAEPAVDAEPADTLDAEEIPDSGQPEDVPVAPSTDTSVDEDVDASAGEEIVVETDDGEIIGDTADEEFGEIILDDTMPQRPSKHEVHAVEAQIQFALLVLVVLSVLFIIFARIDDWRNYRR